MTDVPDPVAFATALGFEAGTGYTPIQGGWDNYLWRFRDGGGSERVLRVFRVSGGTEGTAAAARNEGVAMRIARAAGLPVPDVLAEGVHQGIPAAVHEWMPGETAGETLKRNPWKARKIGRATGRLQARLHQCPPEGLRTLEDSGWETKVADAGLIELARREASPVAQYCHLDFHPLNILMEQGEITALLDFRNAAAGDLRADLGLTWVLLTAPPLPPGLTSRIARVLLRRVLAGWREGYTEIAGSFPLTPLFEAIGVAVYRSEFIRARAEGRGWATEKDIERLSALLDERKRQLGL